MGPLGVGIGGSGGGTTDHTALTNIGTTTHADLDTAMAYPYLGFGTNGTLSAEVDVQGMQLVNEFMGFPAVAANDADLVTLNLWFEDLSTPTTKVTFADLAGEAGITETYEYALKCAGDSSGDGWYQRLTYADQPRVKSGRKLSGLFAVWCPAGRVVTIALTTSTPTTVSAVTTTTAAWETIKVENLTLDGTYVDVKASIDGTGAFYVVPLGLCIGPKAVPLPPRPLRYVDLGNTTAVVNNVDPAGAGYTDVDLTANTSNLAVAAVLFVQYRNLTTAGTGVKIRRNGNTQDGNSQYAVLTPSTSLFVGNQAIVWLDDGQVYEYTTGAAAGDSEAVYNFLTGYWEWA